MNFTVEETNLICIYNKGDRLDLIKSLEKAKTELADDEVDLLVLIIIVIDKLSSIEDEVFDFLSYEFISDYE